MLRTFLNSLIQTNSRVEQITPADLQERLQKGERFSLVDVRSPAEYERDGHIRGARLIPLHVLAQRSGELPQDQSIVCVCRSGNRSQAACEQLSAQGYSNVLNLSGGMIGWRGAGLPVSKPAPRHSR